MILFTNQILVSSSHSFSHSLCELICFEKNKSDGHDFRNEVQCLGILLIFGKYILSEYDVI